MYSTTKNKTIYESSDIMFKTPFTMNIIGPSKCGKTILIYRQNNHVYTIINDYCSKTQKKLSKNDIRGTF